MSEALIFSFGSILFIITTAASFSFGLHRMYEVQADDMAEAGRYAVTRPDGLTELHVADDELEDRAQLAADGMEDHNGVD